MTDLAFPEFEPHPTLRGAHVMTVANYLKPRRWQSAAKECEELRSFQVDVDNQVMARCHWQPDRRSAPTLVVVHGFSGSADSGYVVGTADKAWALGFNVVRLNLRNCGGTEHLATTLYHSGMSEDVEAVVRELRAADDLQRFCLVGFSMGGNIVLRLAGRMPADLSPHVMGVAAVSPALDLSTAVNNIDRGAVNFVYRQAFLSHLGGLIRRKARRFPERFDRSALRGIKTIRAFDDRFTSREFGFGDAEAYYRRATALPYLKDVRIPTLLVQSEDDPMSPAGQVRTAGIEDNQNIELRMTEHGGHCAFIGRRPAVVSGVADLDRYWAENRVLRFFLRLG